MWPIETWHGCYDKNWKGLISDGSFAHPAKMSRALLERIFAELRAMSAIQDGSLVLDCFNGIGTTGIIAAVNRCRYVGCELEPKFFGLTQENFELHRQDWAITGRPMPVVVNGDSRKLRSVLMMSAEVDALVSSPPYAEIASGAGGLNTKPAKDGQQGGRNPKTASQDTDQRYGDQAGQLAKMPLGDVDALVSSPPWGAGAEGACRQGKFKDPEAFAAGMSEKSGKGNNHGRSAAAAAAQLKRDAEKVYGESPGQLGIVEGETFWSAAKQIVSECHAVLKPGGHAVWVVKAFVRNKAIVDFPGDWRRLCEHVGFEMVKEVHASLVAEEHRNDLFDGPSVRRREKKSFFRRLAEKNGSPRIDYEVVLIMRKR